MTNFYAILTPLVLSFIVIEFIYCLIKKNRYYEFQDSISSLGTMVVTQCLNVFYAYIVYQLYMYLYEHFSFYQIQSKTIWTYLLCFIGVDFFFYWYHRFGHTLNVLWAFHMPHHSTEELNYAVGLRASWTTRLISFLYYWPLVLIGFHPAMIIEVVAINLVLQLIPHTRVIPKLGFLETFLNTPSHHRVHHGLNPQYLDKNYAGFFIIWDKIFGTFEEEKEEVFYGVTKPPKSWDPNIINFQWLKYLWEDCKKTKSWWDKLRIWFMPLGWKPKDVEKNARVYWTKKMQVKYQSKPIKNSYPYLLLQVPLGLLVMLLVIHDQSPLNNVEKILTGFLLWMMATSWSGFLESKKWIYKFELTRLVIFVGLLGSLFVKYELLGGLELILILTSFTAIHLMLIRQNDKSTYKQKYT